MAIPFQLTVYSQGDLPQLYFNIGTRSWGNCQIQLLLAIFVRSTAKPNKRAALVAKHGISRICGAVIANKRSHIQSHITHQHDEKLARHRDSKKTPENPWVCPCDGVPRGSWVNYLNHLHSTHGFRGVSKAIREARGVKIDKNTNRVIMPRAKAEDQEEEMEEVDEPYESFLPPDHGPKGPEHKDDDDEDGGLGPSGAAGGLIQATA
ncbi:hypothetical protein PG994_009801 [Apiospora phragmitis]|uniref:Uncharacterized protein n=1 Tax=Apiospora phragmitis TaxID=2905665 RepID=A0ABR1U776_9PEZI